jgi:ferredoxin-NADP reductase
VVVVVIRIRIHRLSWANEVSGAEEFYVKYFRYWGRRCLRHIGCHQRGGDAGGIPTLAQRSGENPPDRCSRDEWVLVCDSALHHGLQHESQTCRCRNNRASANARGVAHCACARPGASTLPEDIDRAPYKASHSSLKALGIAIFVISFALVSIPTLSELLRLANPGSLGLRLTTVLIVTACLVQCALVFKKRKQSRASMELRSQEFAAQAFPLTERETAKDPMNLLLAQIEQQTHDTKTLRFQIPRERQLRAKPGQFLNFQWTIDGQRVMRSYTISSSPIHGNYVEITPKRTENGCVSIFLNERARLGLKVEARGRYGQFYFDETVHKSIVLIAAGSGITPTISMLRYIDDLKLVTSVTLLYWVRTAADIIFKANWRDLKDRSPTSSTRSACRNRNQAGRDTAAALLRNLFHNT